MIPEYREGRRLSWSSRRGSVYGPGLHLMYAHRGGGPVLRTDASWRQVSGLLINARTWRVWIQFRHLPADHRG